MASPPHNNPRIVVIEGKEKGKVFPLKPGTTVIGRSKGDIVVQDARMSRSHVALNYDAVKGILTFKDLKSLNGVQLNNEKKESGLITDGDQLKVGSTTFDFNFYANTRDPSEYLKEASIRLDSDLQIEPKPIARSEPENKSPQRAQTKKRKQKKEKPELRPRTDSPARDGSFAIRAVLLGIVVVGLVLKFGGGKGAGMLGDSSGRDLSSIKRLTLDGKYQEAMQVVEEIKKTYPNDAELLELEGDVRGLLGDYNEAVQAYQRSRELDSKRIQVSPKIARYLLMAGLKDEALQEQRNIEKILTEGPHTKGFFLEVAKLYFDYRDFDNNQPEKLIIIGQAIQKKFAPDEPIGFKLEAVGHLLMNNPGQAIAQLEKARTLDPQDESVLKYLVFSKEKNKDHEGALQLLDLWLSAFPKSPEPLSIVIHSKFEAGDDKAASEYIGRLLSLSHAPRDPIVADALFVYGKILERNQRADEAKKQYQKACEMDFQPACQVQ